MKLIHHHSLSRPWLGQSDGWSWNGIATSQCIVGIPMLFRILHIVKGRHIRLKLTIIVYLSYRIYLVKCCDYYYTCTLVSKIGVATIQSWPPFDTEKQFLSHYFHSWLWAPLIVATNWGAASNQVNTVFSYIIYLKV